MLSKRSGHLHVADAVQKGFRKVYVCTVNTDIMVLVIAAFELWIAFGTGSFIIMIPQKRVCATRITSSMLDTTSSLILQEEPSTVKTEACCAHTNSVRSTLQFLQREDGMKHVEHFS